LGLLLAEQDLAAADGRRIRHILSGGLWSGRIRTCYRTPLLSSSSFAGERVEIAMALWESLTDAERGAELGLTPEQEAELDRRLAEHIANPGSAIPWEEVRRKLAGGA
jgi:putative addiction module component (TIGR02574 family)